MPQESISETNTRYDSRLFRSLVAMAAAAVALLVRMAIDSAVQPQAPWLILIMGVAFSAWYGGLKPGLLTTLLLLPGGYYLNGNSGELGAALFAITAVAICMAMQTLRMEKFRSQTTGQRLHEVLESTQDAILSLDRDLCCLYANRPAGQIAKKDPSLLYGKSLRLIFPETPTVTLYRELNRVVRERIPSHFTEKTAIARRWYEFEAYPTPAGLNLFVRDVTARKALETEQAAIRSTHAAEQLRLESVLRELPVGVIITTREMRVEVINPAAAAMFGDSIHTGDNLDSIRTGTLQTLDGAPIDRSDWPVRLTFETGERGINHEVEYLRPDGMTVTLIINTLPLTGADGNVMAVLGTYLDVTSIRQMQKALRASEGRLRRLFESPVIGIVSGDEEKLLEANDAYLTMLGYTREELEQGMVRWQDMTPPGYSEADERARLQLQEQGFCDPVEKELFAKGGHRVPVLAGTTSYDRDHWSPWISWVLDLSDRRKLENRLREAAKLESIGLLAGGIAHDFNNILTSVMGNTSLAFEALPPRHETREWLQNAMRATERAADLTRQLLAYAGKGQFVVRSVDASEVMSEISQLIRASISRQIDLELALAPGLPAVEADATQLQQLLMNLVINAAEAVGETAGAVIVRTESVQVNPEWLQAEGFDTELPPGEYVSIDVSDTGCGMDSETLKRIFDPFFTTKFTGRGLGLAAAMGIVRAHHGAIRVRSAAGQGSSFRVLLPASARTVRHAVTVHATEPVAGTGTILVVDDEEAVRSVAKGALERYGYTVLTAEHGREALDIYRGLSHGVDLVILDVTMPKMSGQETLLNLLAIHAEARILLSSGFSQEEAAQPYGDFGAVGFLQKPYTAAALAARVAEVMKPSS
jgi:PAS domain S-box-containing protein